MWEGVFGMEAGTRFTFGKNWQKYLRGLTPERIGAAEASLLENLGSESLSGRSFLDIGSGSGLFSLAAMRLGATRVYSFDYDNDSVAATQSLKQQYYPNASNWHIERGDVLDPEYIKRLGEWDIVYSWGVLHHTGAMWDAVDHAASLVAQAGTLYIALYNDEGRKSRIWRAIKRFYNRGPAASMAVVSTVIPFFVVKGIVGDVTRRRNPLQRFTSSNETRGMDYWRDWIDWLGGYPYEVSRPDQVFSFLQKRHFRLERMICNTGLGCSEFVFRKDTA
jgi:2-polyprenyl-3-methyl-5-hydroxy-6-metoxy-1,4-benzoquinol methylase